MMIELGEVSAAPGADPDDDRPGPGLDRRMFRQVALFLVAVLCVFTTTASVRPEQRGVRPLWSVPASESDGTMVTADMAYLQRTDASGVRVSGHDLATGALRWSRLFPGGTVGYMVSAEDDRMLLLPVDRQAVDLPTGDQAVLAPAFHRDTIALDAHSGAELWRLPGEPQTVAGGTTLLTEYDERGRLRRMRMVRLSDHTTVWTKDTPGVENHTVALRGGLPTRVITADVDGQIKIFRYADGSLVTSGKARWVRPRPDEGFFNDLSAEGDFLVVNRSQQEWFDATVYRLDTMAELWSADDTNGYAYFCGAAVCLNDGAGINAWDPATGRARWRITGAANAGLMTDDRLLFDDGVENGHPVLIDTATGRTVGPPTTGSAVWSTEPGEFLLLLRPTVSPPNRTSITRWDLRTGHQDLLGSIEKLVGYRCQSIGEYLACLRGGAFEVTAVG